MNIYLAFLFSKNLLSGASLVVQWLLRIHLPMQGPQV